MRRVSLSIARSAARAVRTCQSESDKRRWTGQSFGNAMQVPPAGRHRAANLDRTRRRRRLRFAFPTPPFATLGCGAGTTASHAKATPTRAREEPRTAPPQKKKFDILPRRMSDEVSRRAHPIRLAAVDEPQLEPRGTRVPAFVADDLRVAAAAVDGDHSVRSQVRPPVDVGYPLR
jgi:hypothetical protein